MKDPEFLEYSEEGLLLTNYYASYHPSQPNYFDQGTFFFLIEISVAH